VVELFAFARPDITCRASQLGLDALIVDLERAGKEHRQLGFDTQISAHTIDDLKSTRAATDVRIVCRIDAMSADSARQIDAVVNAGANEILVPMIESTSEVDAALSLAAGRVAVGVMIETSKSLAIVDAIAELPISRAYLGLNDLWIERRTPTRFAAISDGTSDKVAAALSRLPFGVAGLTHPMMGSPLPCRHLINELSRLNCGFTFLRRAFFTAIESTPVDELLNAIRSALATADQRTSPQVEVDRRLAHRAIDSLPVDVAPDHR